MQFASELRAWKWNCRISMPNTPAMVGQGMTVWTATEGCSSMQRATAQELLSSFGDEHFVDDELPRYGDRTRREQPCVRLLVRGGADGYGRAGLSTSVAGKLVLAVEGSVAYLKQSDKHVAALNITSPGGTTAAAVYSSEQGGFRTTVADGCGLHTVAAWSWAATIRMWSQGAPNRGSGSRVR